MIGHGWSLKLESTVLAHKTAPDGLFALQDSVLETPSWTVLSCDLRTLASGGRA
jgi:hypothetical protein